MVPWEPSWLCLTDPLCPVLLPGVSLEAQPAARLPVDGSLGGTQAVPPAPQPGRAGSGHGYHAAPFCINQVT